MLTTFTLEISRTDLSHSLPDSNLIGVNEAEASENEKNNYLTPAIKLLSTMLSDVESTKEM